MGKINAYYKFVIETKK